MLVGVQWRPSIRIERQRVFVFLAAVLQTPDVEVDRDARGDRVPLGEREPALVHGANGQVAGGGEAAEELLDELVQVGAGGGRSAGLVRLGQLCLQSRANLCVSK